MTYTLDDSYLHPEEIPQIDPEALKKLSKLRPWRSILAISTDWAIIILSILLCEWISYWFYPLAFVLIGSRFHGLEAMMHEATHYRLHPNRNVNEFIGELSVWPMGLSLFMYRENRHFTHHRYIGTKYDSHTHQIYNTHPNRFDVPKPLHQILKICLITAIRFPAEIWWRQLSSNARFLPRLSKKLGILWIGFQIMVLATIITCSILFGFNVIWIYLLFFILPLMWIAVFSRYLRLLTEHFGIPVNQKNPVIGAETRTVLVSWPIRVLFWPHNLNYHLEHHWFPSVPYYNLPALHKLLQESSNTQQKMHISRGIRKLIRELTSV